MNPDIASLTISSAADGLRRGEFSSVELTNILLDAMEEGNAATNAFLEMDREYALRQATAADSARAEGRDGALLGVPIAVKDNFSVANQPLTCGSRYLQGYVAPFDATVISRLRSEGVVFAGRTNMDEFAMGFTSELSAFGPVRNPLDLNLVPGGSSGGSAAAVAGGMAIAALGSDTGGSVRQPAAFCGCVGIKPSYGLVSRYGITAMASSLDQAGPITANVSDTAILLKAMAGLDKLDHTTRDAPVPDYTAALKSASLKGLKIGLPREYFTLDGADPEVISIVRQAADLCAGMGAEVEETSLPHTEYLSAIYTVISCAEASASLARFDGVRYGKRINGDGSLQDLYNRSRTEGFGLEVKKRLLLGVYVLSSGRSEEYYQPALRARTLVIEDFDQAFRNFDLLLTPTSATAAYPIGEREKNPFLQKSGNIFTLGANISGCCAISVPCGNTALGLPVGMQFFAPVMAEEKMLKAAYAYEQGRLQ